MPKWERALFQMAMVAGAFFVWLIAAEVGVLPANSRGNGVLFRWQVWLLTGLFLIASRDFVSQVRCCRCGSREDISPLRLLPGQELVCRSCLGCETGVLPVEEALPPSASPTAFSALPDALQPFWVRRPNKTWLPASWISTTRFDLRRWTAGLFAPYRKRCQE